MFPVTRYTKVQDSVQYVQVHKDMNKMWEVEERIELYAGWFKQSKPEELGVNFVWDRLSTPAAMREKYAELHK